MLEQEKCPNCGANDFITKEGYISCKYCHTKFKIKSQSSISMQSDIERLLQKCKDEPTKAKRYAGLILDIDPTNVEALRFL